MAIDPVAAAKAASNPNTLYCSFCGKSQYEVDKLIAGPTVFICDECVSLCFDIMLEEGRSGRKAIPIEAKDPPFDGVIQQVPMEPLELLSKLQALAEQGAFPDNAALARAVIQLARWLPAG